MTSEPWSHLSAIHDQEEYISGHMDAGNALREKAGQDVMARLGMGSDPYLASTR